jgi:hypothetical protein
MIGLSDCYFDHLAIALESIALFEGFDDVFFVVDYIYSVISLVFDVRYIAFKKDGKQSACKKPTKQRI